MYVFLKCVGEAVMAKGVRGLLEMVPGAAFLYDVASEAMRRMRERKRTAELREEVLSVANAALDDVKQAAAQVAKEVAPDAPIEDRIVLEMYLTQVPGAVRQSLKRAEDPSGKTVPANFALHDASDLVNRLPQHAARFRPDMPLPGRPGWKLVELLGVGGFGEVWLARNPSLSALKGAVKFGLDPRARDRLLRHEGTLINRVMEQGRHPNVVQLLDAHLEGEAPWLMYEYVPGGDLTGLILSWQSLSPFERVTRTLAALQTLAAALGHFHRLSPPIVHRDLKPANILVSAERGTRNAEPKTEAGGTSSGSSSALRAPSSALKIADFGIGGIAAATVLAHTAGRGSSGLMVSQLAGSYTPLYASPQQQAGVPPEARDDVHALGVIGFQMLTGKLDATLGADYAKMLRKLTVPEPLIELLGDCAAHDPDNRPHDGTELAERLAKLTATMALSPPAVTNEPRPIARPVSPRDAEPREREPEPHRERKPVPRAGGSRRGSRRGWLTVVLVFALIGVPLGLVVALLLFSTSSSQSNHRSVSSLQMEDFGPPSPAPRRNNEWTKAEHKILLVGLNVGEMRLSPDGSRVAVWVKATKTPSEIAVFRMNDGTKAATIEGEPRAFAWSMDSQHLVVAGKKLTVHAAEGGAELYELPTDGEEVRTVEYTPNRKWIVAVTSKRILFWDEKKPVKSNDLFTATGEETTDRVRLAFDSTGWHFAVSGLPGGPRLGNAEKMSLGDPITKDPVNLCALSPKSSQLATWWNNELATWSVLPRSGDNPEVKPLVTFSTPHTPGARVAFAGDRSLLLSWTTWGHGLWQTDRRLPAHNIAGHAANITCAAFNSSGDVLATADDKGGIRIHEMPFVESFGDELRGHSGKISDLQFTSDGNQLLACSDDGIFVWNMPKR